MAGGLLVEDESIARLPDVPEEEQHHICLNSVWQLELTTKEPGMPMHIIADSDA